MEENSAVCSVKGCERVAVARTWCRRHYARWQRTGQLEARPWKPQGQCSVKGCKESSESGGYCSMHRWRIRVHGEPGPAGQVKKGRRKPVLDCSLQGCPRPRRGTTYCHLHNERLRRTGELGPAEPTRVKGRVKPRKDGYVRLTLPDGRRVLEHVYVMEQHLGRRLAPGENVHHKNGVKDSNDIADLELWLVVQPSGQRVRNLMEYIARYHADAMRQMLEEMSGGE